MEQIINFFLKEIACKVVFNHLYKVKVEGLENIPLQGRAILASNHASYLDPMVLYHLTPRKFYSVTAKFLFRLWWLKWVFVNTDCIPASDAIKGAVATLNRDDMILIFPEGGCRCNPKEKIIPKAHKGVIVFALKTGSPVIPIAVSGTFEAWPADTFPPRFFKKIDVRIGKPLHFGTYQEEVIPVDILEKKLAVLMSEVERLLD